MSRRRKLIELSPSRGDALDRVRHFEQLANGQAHSENVDEEEGSQIRHIIQILVRMNSFHFQQIS